MSSSATDELVRGLPEVYPTTGDNRRFYEAYAEQVDELDGYIDEVENILDPQHKWDRTLTVDSGDSYTVPAGEYEYYDSVTVDGTLTVNGTLETSKVTINSGGQVDNLGNIIVGSSVEEFMERVAVLGQLVGAAPRESETLAHFRARVLAQFAVVSCESTIDDLFDAIETIFNVDRSKFELEPRSSPGRAELTVPNDAFDNVNLSESEVSDILERLVPVSYRLDSLTEGTFTYITPTTYNDDNHDASKGYDGLDGNGDPKDNGGTYAGLI